MASLPESADTLYAGELEIRLGDGLVLASGRALRLSVREFELLVAMAQRIGAIATRTELYAIVWGGELRRGDRSVDVYVSKLRGKLEEAMPDRRFIHTHPGFGYRFQPQPARGPTPPPLRTPRAPRPILNIFHEMFTFALPALKTLPLKHRTGRARTLSGRVGP